MNGTISTTEDRVPTLADLGAMGWQIERSGLEGLEDFVQATARLAATAGVSPVLVGVLGDRQAPEVTRIRAYGLVALALGSSRIARRQPIAA